MSPLSSFKRWILSKTTKTTTPEPVSNSRDTLLNDDSNFLERGDLSSLLEAQEYTLPSIVKALVDSYVQMANRMAIVTTCFAGVMVSLASTIIVTPTTSPWQSLLRVFLYAGIIFNSGSTALALVFINKASYLPSLARALLLNNRESWPHLVSHGEPLPEQVLSFPSTDGDFELMIHFGLEKIMRLVWKALSHGCYLGGGTLFFTLGLFMWLNESWVVAACLTVLVMPPAAWLLFTYLMSK